MFSGVGLHSGAEISLRLLPAAADTGIVFVRTDVDVAISASTAAVTDTLLATTIAAGDVCVSTIEHLMSALCACGVDNVVVELDGAEVPIMDGSAAPFVTMIRDVGLSELAVAKRYWKVVTEVSVEMSAGRVASIVPYALPRWEIAIDFDQPVVRQTAQTRSFELVSNAAYVAEIARARTFGFMDDFDTMRDHKRAIGGSLANAIVLDRTEVLNEEGLRLPDEFVAHKLLDVIGDCYVDGHVILGKYVASKPGHALTHKLMQKLLELSAYEEVTELVTAPDFGPLAVAPIAG